MWGLGGGWKREKHHINLCATLCNILQLEKRKWEVQTLTFHQKRYRVISLFKLSDKNSQYAEERVNCYLRSISLHNYDRS